MLESLLGPAAGGGLMNIGGQASMYAGPAANWYGMYRTKRAYDAAGAYAKAAAEAQAKTLEREAEAERLDRLTEEKSQRRLSRFRLSSMEAGYAKAGVLTSGTPATFIASQAGLDELQFQQDNRASRIRRDLLLWQAQNTRISGRNQARAYGNKAAAAMIPDLSGIPLFGNLLNNMGPNQARASADPGGLIGQ